jgi:hypothetical protein
LYLSEYSLYLKKLYFLKTYTLITYLSELLPLGLTLFFLKKIKLDHLKVFFIYAVLLAFFSSTSLYVLNFQHSKSSYLFVLRIYIAVEYATFIFFFSLLLSNKILKKIILFSIIPFWAYCVYNFFISKPDTFNNYPALIEFSVFILVIIYYFYEKMRVVSSIPLSKSISFWLCVGLFIYFTGNLFFLLFVTSVTDKDIIKQMLLIYSAVTITKNIILGSAWFANESVLSDADIIQLPENMNLDDDFNFTKTNNP